MQRLRILLFILPIGLLLLSVPTHAQQQTADTRIDVVLVVDNSGSMQKNDPKNLRISAAKLFTNLLAKGDQVGIVALAEASSTKVVLSLSPVDESSQYFWDLLETIKPPEEFSNYTYIGESLRLAEQTLENVAKPNKQRAVIILTDGLPTAPTEAALKEQEQLRSKAVTDFEAQGIKVFAISLRDEPGEKYLKENVSLPTSGRTYRAESAEQLLTKYIEILTILQDGRYVDSYNVIGNVETFLANVNPRQEIRQINFVFPAQDGKAPVISKVLLPNEVTSGVDKLSKFQDPNWAMWVARPEYVPRFNGEWRTTLESAQATVPLHSVLKSDLRARVIEPIPQIKGDENAIRYYPAGRSLLVRTGALDTEERLKRRLDMFVQMVAPQKLDGFTPDDTGNNVDLAPADGEMAVLYKQPFQPGEHLLNISIAPGDSHVQLTKQYAIIVEPLPTMQAEIGPQGQLPVDQSVRLKVRWTFDNKPATMLNETMHITAAVKRENKIVNSVALQAQPDGTWVGDYLPAESGTHSFVFTAHAQWKKSDGTPRRYTDFLEVEHPIEKQPLVEVLVSDADESQRVNSLNNGIQQTLNYHSYTTEPVELALGVKGVPNGKVYPATITIGPGEVGNRTITISSRDVLKSGPWQAQLEITGPADARLSIPETNVSFIVNGFWARNRWIFLVLMLLLLFAFRGIRTRVVEAIGRNIELLRYGGR